MNDEPGAFRPWMEARLLLEAGFEVTVVTCGVQYMTGKDIRKGHGWCTEEIQRGIRILRTWAPTDHRRFLVKRALNYSSYAILAGIASLFKVGKVHNVFVGTDPIFLMPIVFLVALIKGAPMVLDERDLFPETAVALGVIREGLISRFLFHMQQFFRHKACFILTATPGIKSRLVAYGSPEGKVQLLYNADVYLDEDLKDSKFQRSLREEVGKHFLVGYAGGLGRANDIPTLLRAASHMKDIGELGIVIIGSGERRKVYEEYCFIHNLDNVYFLNSLPRSEARQFLKQIDVCVQPLPKDKHFSHTLTSKTFDYHGLGKPTVFCGHGDTVELLRASGGGISVEPEDDLALAETIRKLWGDKSLRLKMGSSGRAWFETNIDIRACCLIMKKAMEGHGPN